MHKRIWLQINEEYNEPTWCEDKINASDVEYVMADISNTLLEALEELQKGIYDFTELPIYAKNFVYRITTEAIRKAKGD